ncbi:MAG: ribose 5-phosphate isomerase B [Sphingomonadales bacterium]|nr:ribose 5-phosphate isomerase B [Sphingomonadales bacterium]
MPEKPIAIASDHGGFELKTLLIEELKALGHQVLDLGCHSLDSVDYPDYAATLAAALADGRSDRGVILCGTGIGISIAANRYAHVRAALCHNGLTARLARQHNDANVLALGGRILGSELAKDCLREFLATPFEGGRHARRVAKLAASVDQREKV